MPSALIIGAGANLGRSVAAKLSKAGYKVAIASRSTPTESAYKHFVFDAAEPTKIPDLFAKVSAEHGPPGVVIYNAAAVTASPPADPLDVELDSYTRDMNINATSVFVAAREAVRAFDQLGPGGEGLTFIFTGNKLNIMDIPGMLVFGVGKTAAARIMQGASHGYKEKGHKFYYADERTSDGNPVGSQIDGEAHAELYMDLVKHKEQRPWLQTFVKGKGYVDFKEAHGL